MGNFRGSLQEDRENRRERKKNVEEFGNMKDAVLSLRQFFNTLLIKKG
jgi:hypothetical protein